MYVLQNLHWFILLFGVLVFFHELGHFLVAKACGVRVLRFSIGFGPKLLSFTRGSTEYRIAAIPLGGYVKMHGDQPDVELAAGDREGAFLYKPLWQRTAIIFAGPAFNFILAFFVYFAIFAGEQTFIDTRIGIVVRDTPAWRAGLRPGDRIVAVDDVPVRQWSDLQTLIGSRPLEGLRVGFERDGQQQTIEITPKAYTEVDMFEEEQKRGRIGISGQYVAPVLAVVDPESPAALAGLRSGDRIVELNGRAVAAWHEVRKILAALPADQAAQLTVQRDPDQRIAVTIAPAAFPPNFEFERFSSADTAAGYTGLVAKEATVARIDPQTPASKVGVQLGDRAISIRVRDPDGGTVDKPIDVWRFDLPSVIYAADAMSDFVLTVQRGRQLVELPFRLEAREEKDGLGKLHKLFIFGAYSDGDLLQTYTYKRTVTPSEAVVAALFDGQVTDDGEAMGGVVRDATLISKGLSRMAQGRLSADSLGGPIMLFVIAEKSAKLGPRYFLHMLAAISVNLGLLNLLPVPVLDGGHLVFLGIEAVRRRPPSVRTREIANIVGLVLIMALMVFVMTNDVMRFIP